MTKSVESSPTFDKIFIVNVNSENCPSLVKRTPWFFKGNGDFIKQMKASSFCTKVYSASLFSFLVVINKKICSLVLYSWFWGNFNFQVGVLAACSHSGLVEKGISYFYSMHHDFGVTAKPEHYTCMIDLLGRAGRLAEAHDLMKDMPFEPDSTMWGALLGASRIHRNPELGRSAAEKIFELEPENAGMYVLLSNIYASSGKWRDARKMRVMMEERGVKKVPGFSWIEVQNKVHTFSAGDCVHPEKEKIYAFLEDLDMRMKKAGYVSATDMVLHDVEEEEKEHMLKYHSEKLAVAYGILNIPPGRPIRVIKNLRVCGDCHNAFKYISAIEGRLIILRDSNRFHHFRGGSCSCGDYW